MKNLKRGLATLTGMLLVLGLAAFCIAKGVRYSVAQDTFATTGTNTVGASSKPHASKPHAPVEVDEDERMLPDVRIAKVITGSVPDDPLQKVDDGVAHGKLTYLFSSKPLYQNFPDAYLTVRTLSGSTAVQPASSTMTYLLHVTEGYCFDPRFAPDTQHVLFKIGRSTVSRDQHRLAVLDLQTGKVRLASPDMMAWREAWWSPDSKYIAYITGGTIDGSVDEYSPGPLCIKVTDWQTGQVQTVITLTQRNIVELNVNWIDDQTLLYSAVVNPDKAKLSTKEVEAVLAQRPDIYAYSLVTKKAQLLIKDGQHPTISPDGKQIAFFGSQNPQRPSRLGLDWLTSPDGIALSIAAHSGSQRKPLNVEGGRYPFVLWRADNQHFIEFKQVTESPLTTAQIKEWDMVTGRKKLLRTISAQDYMEASRGLSYPSVYPLSLASDDKTLFFVRQEFVGRNGGFYKETDSLEAMNLQSGKVSTISKSSTPSGLDWIGLPPDVSHGVQP